MIASIRCDTITRHSLLFSPLSQGKLSILLSSMVAVHSTMLPLGTRAPSFQLPDANPHTPKSLSSASLNPKKSTLPPDIVSLDDFDGYAAYLVCFICNHCPYVQHIRDPLARLCSSYQKHNVAIFAVSSNDIATHPNDSPEKMAEEAAKEPAYTFPYLYDADQEVAKAYHAACTPDFFLFDHQKRLIYRGQFDSSRPGSPEPATGEDLRAALDAALILSPQHQKPSIGCNIKWKVGNAPEYFKR